MVQLIEFAVVALLALICLSLFFSNNDHDGQGAIPVLAW